jgi:diguanylate cyclase (GGDEF)-like protein
MPRGATSTAAAPAAPAQPDPVVVDLDEVRHAAEVDFAGAVAARTEAVRLLREATKLCAVAVEAHDEAIRTLERAARIEAGATVDELTGALRRNAGFVALEHEIERARRDRTGLVLGFLDVDRLKLVNDTDGHQAGDDLLRLVVSALRASLRSYDVVVRYGGDEFVYSLGDTDVAGAVKRFGTMRGLLSEGAPGSSVSAGFAELGADDDLDTLICRADSDLFARRRTERSGWGR